MNGKNETSQKPVGTREWYDFVGQLADALPGMHLGGQEATHALLDLCQLDATSRVLDIGCGSGNTACLIAEARRQGLLDKVEFRVADAFQLPFEDDWFDVVIVESVLTPLPGDKKQALTEMVRVVRPGGRIGINESTVDPSAPPELLALFAEHPAIHGYFTPQTLRSLFEESGLQVVQMTETKNVDAPSVTKEMGLGGLLSFMIRVYPKILLKLLRDARFRKASRIDDGVTKYGKQYMGYTLIVGQKPG